MRLNKIIKMESSERRRGEEERGEVKKRVHGQLADGG